MVVGRSFTLAIVCAVVPSIATAAAPKKGAVVDCEAKSEMRVRFYDVGQALAVLVNLPDGRNILVDAGESATRPGCGKVCKDGNKHLLDQLSKDLKGKSIAMLWITHQHSDHLGGAVDVLKKFRVKVFVDNGLAGEKRQVKLARQAAQARGVKVVAVDPAHTKSPIPGSGTALQIQPVVPKEWPSSCDDNANNCSIGLRVEYCSSSILLTGDAEDDEEAELDPGGRVTVLQVGHHGSNTSSSDPFIDQVKPQYAVISAGKKGEGLNKTYCHPRQVTVERLTAALGGAGTNSILTFDGAVGCKQGTDSNWVDVPASDRLWATPRDGDVVLKTTGDGEFVREKSQD